MHLYPTLQVTLVAAVLCGCASSAPPNTEVQQDRTRMESSEGISKMDVDLHGHDVRDEHSVPIPAVQAFDALPAAYAKLGIPNVAVVDNTGGVYTIGRRNMSVRGALAGTRLSRYIDCGSGAMRTPADSYDVSLSATTYVTPDGAGSMLHTMVAANARDPGDNRAPVRCTSTGLFERHLAELVAGK
ncbi:MAG: hypothetical protein ACR2MQ_04180 [Gemmatimonadaceae bacterium]